ncbi:MAG: hypothetical protein LIP12_10055 [Clostridiales bacterium]|nr:hypothetical protein [Clostridiales bacterium]
MDKCKIEYTEFENNAQMSETESLLIDKYKPLLNIVDNYESNKESLFDDSHLIWEDCTDAVLKDKYIKESDILIAKINKIKEDIDLLNFKLFCLARSYEMTEENIQRQYFRNSEYKKEYQGELLSFPFGEDEIDVIKIQYNNIIFDSGNIAVRIDFEYWEPNKKDILEKNENCYWMLGKKSLLFIDKERLKLQDKKSEKQKELNKIMNEYNNHKQYLGRMKYDYSQYTNNMLFFILAIPIEKNFLI